MVLCPATADAAPIPRDAARVSRGVCTTSATDPAARVASFSVRARALPSASAFGFSVRLEERIAGGPWRVLRGAAVPAGLGDFEAAKPGALRMLRRLNVRGLHPGTSYRLRVTYRWSTAAGPRSTERTSRSCVVRDVRPDVGLTGEFGWQPSAVGGEVAYRIGLRATDAAALRGTDVPVVVRQGQTVLAVGSLRVTAPDAVLVVPGRRCVQGAPVTVQVDPDGVVDDREAGDDLLAAACAPVSE